MRNRLCAWRWTVVCPLLLLCGCPEQHLVKVRMKAGTGAASAEPGATESAGPPAGYGNVVGVITFDGDIPAAQKIVSQGDSTVKDAAVCAAEDLFAETLVVNAANRGIANAVVFLEKAPPQIKPELAAAPSEPAIFDQRGCRFLPHVVAFRIGQPLLVLSDDPVPHNTHTTPKRNDSFNQTIPPKERTGIPCNYKKPESTPVPVVCDYHAWMKAYHFPVDHPYFAVTDADGKFKIEGLPAGKHTFNVWHESAAGGLLERKVTIEVAVDSDTEKNFSFGAAKFAAAASSPRRQVAWRQLQTGGDIRVTQLEGK